jgi:hypothetical protein
MYVNILGIYKISYRYISSILPMVKKYLYFLTCPGKTVLIPIFVPFRAVPPVPSFGGNRFLLRTEETPCAKQLFWRALQSRVGWKGL